MKMGSLECLICSEQRITPNGNEDVQNQLVTTLWKLFQLDNHEASDLALQENEICLCSSCEEKNVLSMKLVQVRDIWHQLESLEMRLDELRINIQNCVENSLKSQVSSVQNGEKVQSLRARIAKGLRYTINSADTYINNEETVIKQESIDDYENVDSSPPTPLSHDDANSENSANFSSSSHMSQVLPAFHEADVAIATEDSDKFLRIILRPIDHLYPTLKEFPTITLNSKLEPGDDHNEYLEAIGNNAGSPLILLPNRSSRQKISSKVGKSRIKRRGCSRNDDRQTGRTSDVQNQVEHSDASNELITDGIAESEHDIEVRRVLPVVDPFNPSSYTLPSNCQISGCRSRTRFLTTQSLWRHIRGLHKGKTSGAHNVQIDDTATNDTDAPKMTVNIKQVKLDFNTYPSFPTKCKEPGCKSGGNFTKQRLKRHIFRTHILRNPEERPRQVWQEVTYPSHCPYPDCKRRNLFYKKAMLRKHVQWVHQPRNKKEDLIDNYEYPTSCPIDTCKSQHLFVNRSKLRCHLGSVHKLRFGRMKNESSSVEAKAKPNIHSTAADLKMATIEVTTESEREKCAIMCEICGVIVASAYSLTGHMRGHTGEFLHCDKCSAKFRTRSGLNRHKQTNHAEVTPVFQCPYCPKTFKVKQLLKVHKWRHTGHKPKICDLCSEGFFFKLELDTHRRFVHYKELGLEPIQCKICNKIYSHKKYLNQHMKTHTGGGGRYACKICPYSTHRRTDLQEHVSTVHCPDFPYTCSHCGKNFKLERRLIEHEKYHQDNYPYVCQICKRKCASANTLRFHLRKKHAKTDLEKCSLRLDDSMQHVSLSHEPEKTLLDPISKEVLPNTTSQTS